MVSRNRKIIRVISIVLYLISTISLVFGVIIHFEKILFLIFVAGLILCAISEFLFIQASHTYEIGEQLEEQLKATEIVRYCFSHVQKDLDRQKDLDDDTIIDIISIWASMVLLTKNVSSDRRIPYKWFRFRSKADQRKIDSLVGQVNEAKEEVKEKISFIKRKYDVDFGVDFGAVVVEYMEKIVN